MSIVLGVALLVAAPSVWATGEAGSDEPGFAADLGDMDEADAEEADAEEADAEHTDAGADVRMSPRPRNDDRLRTFLDGLDQTGSPQAPSLEPLTPEPSAAPGEDRPEPNYSGLEDEPTGAEDVLIWVPRTLFFPVHLVTEFVLRKPMVWTITRIEEAHVVERFVDFLTFLDGDLTLFPRVFVDFGLRPTVGLSLQWKEFIHEDATFDAGFSFGGTRWISVGAGPTVKIFRDDSATMSVVGSFSSRPDLPFFGYGANIQDSELDTQVIRGGGRVFLRNYLSGLNRVSFAVSGETVEINPELGDSPFVPEDLEPILGDLNVLAGKLNFQDYNWIDFGVIGELDTRSPDTEFAVGSGIRSEIFADFGFDPADVSKRRLRYGAELALFWDITSLHHVLALQGWFAMLERLGGDALPFTELVSMGGAEHMRAYLPNRFLGDSAYEITLKYQWPVWILFDFELFAGIGNSFPGRFEGFTWKRSFLGWGFGLESNWSREIKIQLLWGFGTNRLDSDDVEMSFSRFTLLFSRGF